MAAVAHVFACAIVLPSQHCGFYLILFRLSLIGSPLPFICIYRSSLHYGNIGVNRDTSHRDTLL